MAVRFSVLSNPSFPSMPSSSKFLKENPYKTRHCGLLPFWAVVGGYLFSHSTCIRSGPFIVADSGPLPHLLLYACPHYLLLSPSGSGRKKEEKHEMEMMDGGKRKIHWGRSFGQKRDRRKVQATPGR